MALGSRRGGPSQVPEVNLVPMMDVLMSVLTFFIIISMNLTSEQIRSVDLPSVQGEGEEDTDAPFVVGLNAEGRILLADQVVDEATLSEELGVYLAQNPSGYVRLKADRNLDYDDISGLLLTIRDIGGGRVSLAVE
ncbi:MAG: biopolymer transporter ExbD [Cyanobacteria bacterium P01_A01_bin.135]